MKKVLVFIMAIVLSVTFVNAQTGDPELDYIRKAYSKEKKTIVTEYMNLDAKQAAQFTAVYDAFETSRQKLATERLKLIDEYITNAANITPELADRLAKSVLANNISLDKLNQQYYDKMKKAVGAINAAKFMQLETYLQTTWRGAVQDNIPLIGELDKTHKD